MHAVLSNWSVFHSFKLLFNLEGQLKWLSLSFGLEKKLGKANLKLENSTNWPNYMGFYFMFSRNRMRISRARLRQLMS